MRPQVIPASPIPPTPAQPRLPSDGQEPTKTLKIAPLCSTRPVLAKRFPPSVLAVPRDLRVCLAILDTENHANHDGLRAQTEATFWSKRACRCRGVRILRLLAAAGNLPPQDPKLTRKRDPKSASRGSKRTPKNKIRPKSSPPRKYLHKGGNLTVHN